MSLQPITVFIADDHVLIRQALERGITDAPDLQLVGSAGDGLSAISGIKQTLPQVAILDIAMPNANGIEVFVESRRWSPKTAIIMLTGMLTRGILADVKHRKVDGIFLKSDDPSALIAAIPRVARGEHILSEAVQAIVGADDSPLKALTDRETQVLQAIANGMRNGQIAEHLGVSRNTVENHRANILRKLDVSTAAELLSVALKEGFLDYG